VGLAEKDALVFQFVASAGVPGKFGRNVVNPGIQQYISCDCSVIAESLAIPLVVRWLYLGEEWFL
jgi:hypothetical protein